MLKWSDSVPYISPKIDDALDFDPSMSVTGRRGSLYLVDKVKDVMSSQRLKIWMLKFYRKSKEYIINNITAAKGLIYFKVAIVCPLLDPTVY
ncbi:hypothetical protein D5086_015306 [Populus alba]|uniref:Uncharacterized protein n=1 Tax=Populus alba TaxID=43335 RepID=A0ACC4C0N7_POPAL